MRGSHTTRLPRVTQEHVLRSPFLANAPCRLTPRRTKTQRQAREGRTSAIEKIRTAEKQRRSCEEEGLTFENGITVGHRRWRPSPALAAVLTAHPCQARALCRSRDQRWVLSGGNDSVVRLWDTEAFVRELESRDGRRAASAADRAGAVAADAARGWECARELRGHAALVTDVALNPRFRGPCGEALSEKGPSEGSESGMNPGAAAPMASPDGASGHVSSAPHADKGPGQTPVEEASLRLPHTLASASADHTLCIWDLGFNPRIPRCVDSERRQGPSTVGCCRRRFSLAEGLPSPVPPRFDPLA